MAGLVGYTQALSTVNWPGPARVYAKGPLGFGSDTLPGGAGKLSSVTIFSGVQVGKVCDMPCWLIPHRTSAVTIKAGAIRTFVNCSPCKVPFGVVMRLYRANSATVKFHPVPFYPSRCSRVEPGWLLTPARRSVALLETASKTRPYSPLTPDALCLKKNMYLFAFSVIFCFP